MVSSKRIIVLYKELKLLDKVEYRQGQGLLTPAVSGLASLGSYWRDCFD